VNRPRYRAGIAASLIAEAVFIAMVAMVALLRGRDPWMVARVPASFLLGPDAVQPPGFVPRDVLLGLGMHLALGVLVGVIYAALLPRLGVSPVVGGLITGAVLYALGFWVSPLLFPVWLAPFWLPPTGKMLQGVAHAVYGVVFGLAFRQR
jgi:ribose/xylose/arabinose/galactoside ABC-type transport system permease subunit